jgi:hypothetical protein
LAVCAFDLGSLFTTLQRNCTRRNNSKNAHTRVVSSEIRTRTLPVVTVLIF